MIAKLKLLSQSKPCLIFDFDKTIAQMEIDWTGWHSGVAKIYSKYDINHGYKRGKNPHEYYNILVEKHGNELAEEIKKFVSEYEQANIISFTPYQELVDFIKANTSNKKYIFSSNSHKIVEKALKSLGILNLFEKIISRDNVTKVKPDIEGYFLINGLEENKENYLMIGDSGSDESSANLAGIDFLKCSYFETYNFSGNTK